MKFNFAWISLGIALMLQGQLTYSANQCVQLFEKSQKASLHFTRLGSNKGLHLPLLYLTDSASGRILPDKFLGHQISVKKLNRETKKTEAFEMIVLRNNHNSLVLYNTTTKTLETYSGFDLAEMHALLEIEILDKKYPMNEFLFETVSPDYKSISEGHLEKESHDFYKAIADSKAAGKRLYALLETSSNEHFKKSGIMFGYYEVENDRLFFTNQYGEKFDVSEANTQSVNYFAATPEEAKGLLEMKTFREKKYKWRGTDKDKQFASIQIPQSLSFNYKSLVTAKNNRTVVVLTPYQLEALRTAFQYGLTAYDSVTGEPVRPAFSDQDVRGGFVSYGLDAQDVKKLGIEIRNESPNTPQFDSSFLQVDKLLKLSADELTQRLSEMAQFHRHIQDEIISFSVPEARRLISLMSHFNQYFASEIYPKLSADDIKKWTPLLTEIVNLEKKLSGLGDLFEFKLSSWLFEINKSSPRDSERYLVAKVLQVNFESLLKIKQNKMNQRGFSFLRSDEMPYTSEEFKAAKTVRQACEDANITNTRKREIYLEFLKTSKFNLTEQEKDALIETLPFRQLDDLTSLFQILGLESSDPKWYAGLAANGKPIKIQRVKLPLLPELPLYFLGFYPEEVKKIKMLIKKGGTYSRLEFLLNKYPNDKYPNINEALESFFKIN